MSDNTINTLGRIDQAIRGLNEDTADDSYIPAQSTNGALERINKSIRELDIKGIKSGLPKVTNNDNGKVLQVKNGKWAKGEIEASGMVSVYNTQYADNYAEYSKDADNLYLVDGAIETYTRIVPDMKNPQDALGTIFEGPMLIPAREEITNHEAWRAFHDGDSYGWTQEYSSESEGGPSYLQVMFDVPKLVQGISVDVTFTGEQATTPMDVSIWYTVDGTEWLHDDRDDLMHQTSINSNRKITHGYGLSYGLGAQNIVGLRIIPGEALYSQSLEYEVDFKNINILGMSDVDVSAGSTVKSIWYLGQKYGEINNEIIVINGTWDNSAETLSLDKTYDEIISALDEDYVKTAIIKVKGMMVAGYSYFILNNRYDHKTVKASSYLIFNYLGNKLEFESNHISFTQGKINLYGDGDILVETHVNENIPIAEPTPRGPIPLKLAYADGGDSHDDIVSYTGTYTATSHCYVLAFCQIVNGQNAEGGANLTNTISVSSSKQPMYSDYSHTDSGSNPSREHATRMELYEMDANDVLTFSVGLSNNFIFKNRQDYIFLAFIVDDYYVENVITQVGHNSSDMEICPDDNVYTTTATRVINGSSNKDYLILSFEYEATTNASNSVESKFEVIGNAYCDPRYICGKNALIERRTSKAVSISAGFARGEGVYTLNCYFGSGNSYYSKGFAVYRLN